MTRTDNGPRPHQFAGTNLDSPAAGGRDDEMHAHIKLRMVFAQLSAALTSTTISLSGSASSSGPESMALSPHQGHPAFITLLSTPSRGSSADKTVEEWLVSKFAPPNSSSQRDQVHDGDGETTPDGEKERGYMCGGV